ncbi:RapZ C-terminal domain-containing protein, partial [Bacillus pumilus]|uniref:RapZ C-terminal domain-containing protein n=1 Tax=Bacillus pumilus TaxID=1408 RepID=UPI0028CB6AD2
MRGESGKDEEVGWYVMKWREREKLREKLIDLVSFMVAWYKREGKSQVVMGIGCT